VRRTVISIDSEKTGMRVELPLPQPETTLEAGPTGDVGVIVRGAPWTKGAPGDRIRGVGQTDLAGEARKSVHGIRTAAVTRAAGNVATEREPEAVFRLVRPADGDAVRQKREPRQACRGGHRQVRPCRDRKKNIYSRTYG
jgi:hypothetical protein